MIRQYARQAAILAMLLDADGAVVSYAELGELIGSSGINDSKVIRQYVTRLRQQGVLGVEVVTGRGCRLRALPPDSMLDDVLTMLDVIRREGYARPVVWRVA